jgi:flagellar hook-associated protein 3 FlgL
MRVTNLINQQRRVAELLRGQERLEAARDRVSTGRRIQRPSDNPGEIADLLRTRSQISDLERRTGSIDSALPSMRASEAALGDLSGLLREARVLTLQANNAAVNSEQRQALADQLGRIAVQVRERANAHVGERYLFAGTETGVAPFALGPPVVYSGNATPIQLGLGPDTSLAMNIPGDALLNERGGTDLFANLATLEDAIRVGDGSAVAAHLEELDTDLENVLRLRADMGGRLQYVAMAREQVESGLLAARERQSQLQDADLAEAILQVATAENAQEATLAAAARLTRPSLLDYLR